MNDFATQAVHLSTEGDAKLGKLLDQAYHCISEFDQEYADALAGIADLQNRRQSGTFRLAVLGQFKRGKSTLLNALLGEELLPTDILPVTAIPTFIISSETVTARVLFSGRNETVALDPEGDLSLAAFLSQYVTEKGNPNNQLGVERVEIGHPAAILEQGVVLIDTPGIGSTHKHNTEVAYQVLPQCDAALFLVSADPPITEVELEYLKDIKQHLPRTFFLLNKIDNLDDREKVASINFLADQLTPLCQAVPQIIAISARQGLRAKLGNDDEGWKQSGMKQVESSLVEFFADEKKLVLIESLQRRLQDQLHNVRLRLQLSLTALQLPEEELSKKIAQFRSALPEIEREKLAAEDVLAGDHDRVVAILNQTVNEIRNSAKGAILEPVEKHLHSVEDTEELERTCRQLIGRQIPVVFTPAVRATVDKVHKEAVKLLELHQQRCDMLIEKVRQVAAELFAIPYRAPSASQAILTFEVPGWSSDLFISDMDPLGQKISRKFFTRKYRHKKTVQRLRQETLKLIGLNVEQIGWALRKSVDESFRKYRAQLNQELEKTVQATQQAIEIALHKNEQLTAEQSSIELKFSQAIKNFDEMLRELDAEDLQPYVSA